jgi:Lon protease-like protein
MLIDPDSLSTLAIFPLPNAVLLPGGILPLHVFEPRYREMTRDCLAGSRTMAIALLTPGFAHDYAGRPPVRATAGLGSIIASEELGDGRFHLMLRGVGRVHIDEELAPDRSYRQVRASLVDATHTNRPDALRVGHQQVLALCDRLAFSIGRGGRELCELAHAQPDGGACADALAAALVPDPDARQTLLEMLDAADRVDATAELLGRILCELAPQGALN